MPEMTTGQLANVIRAARAGLERDHGLRVDLTDESVAAIALSIAGRLAADPNADAPFLARQHLSGMAMAQADARRPRRWTQDEIDQLAEDTGDYSHYYR